MKKILLFLFTIMTVTLSAQITITNSGNNILVKRSGSTEFTANKSQLSVRPISSGQSYGSTIEYYIGGEMVYRNLYNEVDSPTSSSPSDLVDTLNSYIGTYETSLVFADGAELKQIDGKLRTSSMPYTYDIAEGNISDHFSIYKFGGNPDVGTSEETIWYQGGVYDWDAVDAAAGIVTVSSSDVDDVAGIGSGAWTCTIYGLSSTDSTTISETVSLDGRNAVNSTLEYYRVNRIIVNTAGTSEANEGIIYVGTGTVSTGVPAVIWSTVAEGKNQTLQSIWTVPKGKTLYMTSFTVSTNSNKGNVINIYFRPPNQLFQIKANAYLFSTALVHQFEFPLMLSEGTDIDCRAVGTATGAGIALSFEAWYE